LKYERIFPDTYGEILTPKERDIEKLQQKIQESENMLKTANQHGPFIIAGIGIVSSLTFFMGFSIGFFVLGLLLILSAVIWAYFKTQQAVKLKNAIFGYKMEIYRIENKP
jgi:tellurite resistance protein TehA-like permease